MSDLKDREQNGGNEGLVDELSLPVDDAISRRDADGHGRFRGLCVVYGDSNRSVFLQEFLKWFVRNASRGELDKLRKAIASRAKVVGKGRKRGRPRVEEDDDLRHSVKVSAWRRIVDGWTWWQIAESAGMKPTKANIKTLERRLSRNVDQYAAIIWRACADAGFWHTSASFESNLVALQKGLETNKLRQWLWAKTGLPFPQVQSAEGCIKIVLALAPRGKKTAADEFARRWKKQAKQPSPSVKK
jgi:hypothetical protein